MIGGTFTGGQDGLLAAVIMASLDCIVVIDEAGTVVEWNPAAEATFGYPRAAAIGAEISGLIIPPRFRDAHAAGMARYLAGGAPRVLGRRVELAGLCSDGREIPVELTITEVPTGARRLFTASLRDLSERQRAERALSESKARLDAFLDHAPVGMFIKALDGRYEYANPSAAELFGLAAEAIRGRYPRDLLDGASGDAIGAIDRMVADEGREHVAEQSYRTLAGRSFEALTARFPLFGQDGAPTHIGVVMLDISPLRQAESELAESRRKLAQSEKISALGSLLAGVSHELNNPLAVVVGESYLLAEDAEGTALGERADRVREAAERCSRIVQTFLAMARRKQPEMAPTDLSEVIAGALALTAYGRDSEGIALDAQVPTGLPAVQADRNALHQVLVNLIVNAQQALAGRADARLTVDARSAGGQVTIEVRDNGPGIAPAVAERIFEPFFTTKPEGAGTGIGLSFSQGVVESHGGTLTLAPSATGAAFRIALPALAG